MASIVETFAGDRALQLNNEEFVRRMAWGSDWKRLAIGVNHSGQFVGNTVGNSYYIGLCQGTDYGVKSASCVEWVGMYAVGGTWNYVAGPPASLGIGGTNYRWGYKIGATLTQSGATSVGNSIGVTNRDYWICYIEQTAAGYTIRARTPSSTPTVDKWGQEFEFIMCQGDSQTTSTVNFATNRLLDSVNIYWDYAAIGIELSEIMVVRYA